MIRSKRYLPSVLFTYFLCVTFCFDLVVAQHTIGGKTIKKGVWNNKQIDYVDGQIALKLKLGVQRQSVMPVIN